MDNLFAVHMLNDEGKEKAAGIARCFDDLLTNLKVWCGEEREFSIVKTKLEEAAFFAKKAMACKPENQVTDSPAVTGTYAEAVNESLGKGRIKAK